MWYVFPQLDLGTSRLSKVCAIKSVTEAQAYLADATLGPRLREITLAALDCGEEDPTKLFPGGIDEQKFKACLTLFSLAEAGTGDDFFTRAASKFWPDLDNETVDLWQKLPQPFSAVAQRTEAKTSEGYSPQSAVPMRRRIPPLTATTTERSRRPTGITKARPSKATSRARLTKGRCTSSEQLG